MGVESAIRSHVTREKGMMFVDDQKNDKVVFPVRDAKRFTPELGIMRGQLTNILYEATKGDVEYLLGDYVKTIKEDSEGVTEEFGRGLPPRRFDVLVGCDGWASRTRKLAFGSEVSNAAVSDLGLWTCYCTIPFQPEDDGWAHWFLAPRRRSILFRADNEKISRASLSCMPEDEKFETIPKPDVETQKEYWIELFSDLAWKKSYVSPDFIHIYGLGPT